MTPPAPIDLAQRNSDARGGASAIERVRGVDVWVDLRVEQTRLRGRLLANRDRCLRIDIYDRDERIHTEGVVPDGAWRDTMMEGADTRTIDAAERAGAALKHSVQQPFVLYGLHEIGRLGHRISAGEPVTIDSRNYFRLDVTYTDGYSGELYLSRSDALIERMRERRPGEATARRVEMQVSDYRDVGGVRFPFLLQEIDIDSLETLSSARVERLALNTPDALAVCEADMNQP